MTKPNRARHTNETTALLRQMKFDTDEGGPWFGTPGGDKKKGRAAWFGVRQGTEIQEMQARARGDTDAAKALRKLYEWMRAEAVNGWVTEERLSAKLGGFVAGQ